MSYYATGVSIMCSSSSAQTLNHGPINKIYTKFNKFSIRNQSYRVCRLQFRCHTHTMSLNKKEVREWLSGEVEAIQKKKKKKKKKKIYKNN